MEITEDKISSVYPLMVNLLMVDKIEDIHIISLGADGSGDSGFLGSMASFLT